MSVGNIPNSLLLFMLLSCLFKDNIFDSDVKTPSCKNVGDLGVFGWMNNNTSQNNRIHFSHHYLCCVTWSFPFVCLCLSLLSITQMVERFKPFQLIIKYIILEVWGLFPIGNLYEGMLFTSEYHLFMSVYQLFIYCLCEPLSGRWIYCSINTILIGNYKMSSRGSVQFSRSVVSDCDPMDCSMPE